jgi:hypothetical protein
MRWWRRRCTAVGGAPTSNEVVPAGYVLTYYPNTTDAARAQAIEVSPDRKFPRFISLWFGNSDSV